MPEEKQQVESPLNNDARLQARQKAAEVLGRHDIQEQIALELDVSTAKLELARARIAQMTEANIKELEEEKTLSPEDKKKAIAKQRTMLDQAEMQLEQHIEWREFVSTTFNI